VVIASQIDGEYFHTLPEDVVKETSRRYLEIYKLITGKSLDVDEYEPIKARMCRNLVREGLLKDSYIAIIMGSPSDLEHCKEIQSYLQKYEIMTDLRVVSAHKNGEENCQTGARI